MRDNGNGADGRDRDEADDRRGGLSVRGVTVRFGETVAVNDVDLQLPAGQVLAVLGPSGCGKSTLLRAVAGLEVLHVGSVSWAGQDLAAVPTHRRGFALMFQDGQLFAHQSVASNVGYALRLQRVGRGKIKSRVAELLELVGLPAHGDRRPATLSGGEAQRVALARALAAEPRLLLLDEPLSALDRSLRERLAADLRVILSSTGTTALMVTHDHDEAFTVADQMAVMRQGQIAQVGPASAVWRAPADADVAQFLGYAAILTGRQAQTILAAGDVATSNVAGGVTSQVTGGSTSRETGGATLSGVDSQVAVRRSALRLDPGGPLAARVISVAAARDAMRLTVDVAGVGVIDAVAGLDAAVSAGDNVRLSVSAAGLAILPAQH